MWSQQTWSKGNARFRDGWNRVQATQAGAGSELSALGSKDNG